ncbi:MAG: hypothetical protein Q4C73_06355 [Eubacteriales bacterium]|nr:hypothetical protein [Eubacteriales bacterium]
MGTAGACYRYVFSFKHGDGSYLMETFYDQKKQTNDVLFIGTSQIFENINTGILWDEYGMASFDLSASMQPVWNTYYYLKEAIKTQSPKVIVLDASAASMDEEYSTDSTIIKNTSGIKPSMDKLKAVMVSAPRKDWGKYLVLFPTYHTRYTELDADDIPYYWSPEWDGWKGFIPNKQVAVMEKPEGFQTEETGAITAKSEDYLRKICELCRAESLELVMIKSPGAITKDETMKYNRIGEIAGEYGVPFVNFNDYYDAMELDFSADMADGVHLNYQGNIKYTRCLADYLKERYEIPDRRGQAGYESYDVMAANCRAWLKNAQVLHTDTADAFFQAIDDPDYIVVYTVSGDYQNGPGYSRLAERLERCGIMLDGLQGSWAWVVKNGEVLYSSGGEANVQWHTELAPYRNLEVSLAEGIPVIHFNQQAQERVHSGINAVVYDTVTQSIVDAAGFTKDMGEQKVQ